MRLPYMTHGFQDWLHACYAPCPGLRVVVVIGFSVFGYVGCLVENLTSFLLANMSWGILVFVCHVAEPRKNTTWFGPLLQQSPYFWYRGVSGRRNRMALLVFVDDVIWWRCHGARASRVVAISQVCGNALLCVQFYFLWKKIYLMSKIDFALFPSIFEPCFVSGKWVLLSPLHTSGFWL